MMYSSQNSGWQAFMAKRKVLVSCVLGLFFLAIGADIRAELGAGHSQNKILKRGTDTTIWQPAAGVKWQIQLIDAVEDTTADADIWDIDLFDNTAVTISTLQSKGRKVICYFSAGTYEDWRSDISKFDSADFGSNLDDWPGEKWLNIKSTSVRSIMTSRLDMAKEKGCDGVDPDNIDAYGNENGLGLTEADSIDFLTFLASEAHSRGMSIGLKNGGDIIGSVIDKMQWSVNEQCAEYNECDVYAAFTEVNKPVFHIEYSGETIESDSSSSTDTTTDTTTDTSEDVAATTTSSATVSASASSSTSASVSPVATSTSATGTTSAATTTTTTDADSTPDTTTDTTADENDDTNDANETDAEDDKSEDDDSEDDDSEDDDSEDDDSEDDDSEDDDSEDDEDTDDGTETESNNTYVRKHKDRHNKIESRATLSASLKSTACNAKSADKFSTVIKNMNLDAWVEYC
jgi:endo-alpha-1,4-polygalactosaminidase (GH114 family)